jgi:hypothetical protein
MPILSFARDQSISRIIGDWKRFATRKNRSFGKRDISTTVCDLKQGEQLWQN